MTSTPPNPVVATSLSPCGGATTEEVQRAMPGDELLPSPTSVSPRAVTMARSPELSVDVLTGLDDEVPPRDLRVNLRRAPAFPSSGFVIQRVRRSGTGGLPDLG